MQKQLEARLVCYRQGNTRGDVLVEATDINVVLRLGEVSALTFKLPGLYSMGTDAGYVNYTRALIDNWDVALEVSWGKGWYEPFNARFEIVKEERDDDLYGKVALTGVGIISDLAYGFNLSTGKIGKKTGTHDYSMVRAAQIMSDWITSAQSQGSMPRLRWKRSGSGYVTDTAHGWTTATDSAGKAWAANSKVNASFQRTASALDVQRSLVGAVEWVTRGNTLCLYNTGTLEKPLKPGGVELILGRELENIPLAREISERVQRVVAFGEKGVSRTANNGSVGGTRGPRTRAVTVGGEKVLANLTARAEAEVTARQGIREELRRDMDLFHAEFLPWRDFELGARVVSEGWTTAREEYTVSELILRETGPEHGLQVAVTLGDPTKTAVERIQMAVRNLAGSAGDTPQGGASGGVAGAGGSISDPRADEGPPAAPVISSLEVHHTISPSGFTTAGIQVAWSPVTLAASGEPLWRDVLEYRVEGRDGRSPSNPWVYWGSTSGDLGSPVLVKDGLFPGQSYWVRVSARTQEGWGDPSTAVEIFSGQDSTPPPKPKPPILSSAQGTVTAGVTGEFVNNVARPADLSHFEVWAKRGTSAAEMHSTLTGKGVAIIGSTRGEQVEVYLVAVDTSKNRSAPSEKVTITTLGVLDEPQVKQMFDGVLDELAGMDAAHDAAISAIQAEVAAAEAAAATAQATAESAQTAAGTAQSAAEAAQQDADAAAQAASDAAEDLLALSGRTGRVVRSATAPTATADKNSNNLWLNTSTGQLHEWDGNKWKVITDSRLTDAAQAATAATNAASTAQAQADNAVSLANAAQGQADAANSAAAAAQAAATAAQSTADSAASAASAAQGAAQAAQGDADAAAQVAADAAGLAGSKADVLIQPSTPPTSMRKATTLWIDTTNGLNTPKRWDGSKWAVVTDKAAIDAAAAAAAAQSTANQAARDAAAAQSDADAAAAAALAAQATADAADAKATTADGRITTSFATPKLADGSGKPVGALWYTRSGAGYASIWEWNGSKWEQTTIGTGGISTGAITEAKIATGAISNGKLAQAVKDSISGAASAAALAQQTAESAQGAASAAATAAAAAQGDADAAQAAADVAAADLLALAGRTGRVIRATTKPTAATDKNANNLWLNTSTGQLHQWNGSDWAVITDSRLTAATNAADQAANLANAAQQQADTATNLANAAKTQADTATSAASAAQAAATAAQSTASSAQSAASAASADAAAAQGDADAAAQAAAAAAGLATTAQNSIDNLQIGGRNLLLNSATYDSFQTNNTADLPFTSGTDEIGNWITGTDASTGQFCLSTYTRPTYEQGVFGGTRYFREGLELPEVVTQSVEVMCHEPVAVRLSNTTGMTTLTPGQWERLTYTGTPGVRLRGLITEVHPDVPVGTKLYHRNWKLEAGTKATDWTPAPEDVDAATAAAQSAADAAAADAIAKAAAAEQAAKAHADAQANAAQAAAIAAASGDATAKANAAKAAAEATAAADAKAKADAALAAAKTDATTKANAAAAIANSKADVLIQSTAPAAAMRKSTTLWIDTTGGANTPKRWTSGTTWVEVTDKAAKDAAAAAVAAQGTANQAVADAALAKSTADQAVANALAAQNAADVADGKATTATGKITIATANPTASDASGKPIGALWEVRSGSSVLRRYVLTGATTWTQVKIGQDFIGTDAIGQAQIAGLAVGTAEIANGAITNAKIGSLAVGEANIDSAAVTNAKIKDLAVTTAKIANLAVETAKIKDGAIVTAKIGDAQITTAKIEDLAVDDAKIANLAVTEGKIANLAVGTAKIADGAITNVKIGNATIEAAKIKSVNADTITTGTLSADLIDANTISAEKLLIHGGNLFPDPLMQNASAWPNTADMYLGDHTGHPLGRGLRINSQATQVGHYYGGANNLVVSIEPGAKYRVRATVHVNRSASGATQELRFYCRGRNAAGDLSISSGILVPTTGITYGAAAEFETEFTVPSTNNGLVTFGLYTSTPYTAGVHFVVNNVSVMRMVDGVLIENGAVTADKVRADLSMANHFGGLMATFEEAFIGKVKADYVNSGSFSGKLFSGGTFTGSVFRTANTSGARVQMDKDGIRAYNSRNSLTFNLTGSSGSINGFTITGGTVRTSSSGARVEMTSSGTFQGLQRLDTQGKAVMRLGLDSSNVDQALTFWRTTTAGLRNGAYHALGLNADGLTFRNPSNGQEYGGLKGTLNNQLALTSGRAHVMVKTNGLTTLSGSIIDFDHIHPDLVQQTWRLQAASAAGITASTWRFMPGRLKMTQTALAANLHIDANGYIHHTTSARKWKLDIKDVGVDPSLILNVRVRDWIDRSAASLDENYSTRTPGVVAEELEEAGLSEFVTYDELEDGTHISGVLYDRLALLLIPVVRDLRDRLDALEGNK